MPSAAARRVYEDQIPTFMSIFDPDVVNMEDREVVAVVDPNIVAIDSAPFAPHTTKSDAASVAVVQPLLRQPPIDSSHKHNDSTSTQASESADSSPTTTLSTTDSSPLSDPSPSSSPDSPINLIPLASYPGPTFGGLHPPPLPTINASATDRPMTSPSPRRRNMKGLSIQPTFATSINSTLVSEPASPSFIKPTIPAMKRKPSQLSVKTSSTDLMKRSTLEVPASPIVQPPILHRRALKHSTSSPHMFEALKSSTFGPVGGMTIPTVLERNENGLSEILRPTKLSHATAFDSTILEEESPIRTQLASRAAMDFEPYHEREANEDQKSPGYPEGPIAIYGDNVFLYLEPTAEEASRFDVVINVAKEVKNPFKANPDAEPSTPETAPLDATANPVEGRIATDNATATLETPPTEDQGSDTPTTPKAAPPTAADAASEVPASGPEYIHMPWDHNTDIADDLFNLCELIDTRTNKEGKKVLVHCQQGASRSASLIIAYGIFSNPELSVNDAYYAAQSKSRWISPNMKLMYCLQDFQKEVVRRRLPPSGSSALLGIKSRSGRSPTKHRLTLSADNIDVPKELHTAPLPGEGADASLTPLTGGATAVGSAVGIDHSPMRLRGNSTPSPSDSLRSGPASAPSTFSWATEKEDVNDPGKPGRFDVDSIRPPQGPPPEPSYAPPPPPLPRISIPTSNSNDGTDGMAGRSGFGARKAMKPLLVPGLGMKTSMKPPPSPGFAAHRFGSHTHQFGLEPLSISVPPSRESNNDFIFEADAGEDNDRLSNGFGSSLPSLQPRKRQQTGTTNLLGGNNVVVPLIQRRFPPPVGTADDDMALMSPRAESMTKHPFMLRPSASFADLGGLSFVEVPPTPGDTVFSPRASMFPRDPLQPFGRPAEQLDPRSPPAVGETSIVRSIDEML